MTDKKDNPLQDMEEEEEAIRNNVNINNHQGMDKLKDNLSQYLGKECRVEITQDRPQTNHLSDYMHPQVGKVAFNSFDLIYNPTPINHYIYLC